MDLYFSPLACSLAARIALCEAGAEARFIRVDLKSKRAEGADFLAINPMGQVPVLRTRAGDLLTENIAILQHLADALPGSGLAPSPGDPRRERLQQWLGFITSELHKAVFTPLLVADAPEGARAFALAAVPARFGLLERHLEGRETLLEGFSVADAYLATVLNWAQATPIDLRDWPALRAYLEGIKARPGAGRAFAEEGALYVEEQRRARAA